MKTLEFKQKYAESKPIQKQQYEQKFGSRQKHSDSVRAKTLLVLYIVTVTKDVNDVMFTKVARKVERLPNI